MPQDHPLRAIRKLTGERLRSLDIDFGACYVKIGQPSIPLEDPLRAHESPYDEVVAMAMAKVQHEGLPAPSVLSLGGSKILESRSWGRPAFGHN